MTDNEIIKALECCCKNKNCEGCPLDYFTFSSQCASELAIKSLDLIKCLQAENERLKKEKDEYSYLYDKHINTAFSHIKSEAVKEFAERLEEKSFQSFGNYGITRDVVEVCDIDNLVKEMVGDDNA